MGIILFISQILDTLYLLAGYNPYIFLILYFAVIDFYLQIGLFLTIPPLISCVSLELSGLLGWVLRDFSIIGVVILCVRVYLLYFTHSPVVQNVSRETLKRPTELTLPSIDLLTNPKFQKIVPVDHRETLLNVLKDFGIDGTMHGMQVGPTVTLYEFEPAAGLKISRVISLCDDITRSMSAMSVRIALIPGKNFLGIEIANAQRSTIYFKEMLGGASFQQSLLPIALGKDIAGNAIVEDLTKMPHLLVAGTTGAGKSVVIHSMLMSLFFKLTHKQLKLLLIDPKMLEFMPYQDIPHLLHPVVTDPKKAVTALKWVVNEMTRRYKILSEKGVRNLAGYNAQFEPMPYIVVVVDEMADLMLVAGKEVELALQRLAQMGRASGIHIIVATQRPSVDVITGTVKANFPSRISLKVITKIDSRTILGEQGAEQLLGKGDMLYSGNGIVRLQGPWITEEDIHVVANALRAISGPEYIEDITVEQEEITEETNTGEEDARYQEAIELVRNSRKASTSFLVTNMCIGYNRASRIIQKMEKEGIISPPQGNSHNREILK